MSHPPATTAPAQAAPTLPLAAWWEIAGLWLLVVLAGVVLIASLLLDARAQEEASTQRERLSLTLAELQESIEGDLALGFDLPDHHGLQPRLERALASDAQLYAIDVIDRRGTALFSTDRGAVGEASQPRVARAADAGAQQDRIWTAALGSESVMGLPLHGAFGDVVGHISATYATPPVRLRMALRQADGTPTLAALTAAVLVCIAVLGWLAGRWAFAPQARRLAHEQRRAQAQALARSAAVLQRMDTCLARLDESERGE